MTIRVCMIPELSKVVKGESGIHTVIRAWHKHMPAHGIQFTNLFEDSDLLSVHAGMANVKEVKLPIVAHLHGLYWTGDYEATRWEWDANANVITSARRARIITVPSNWVADTIRRDMRVDPYILPHGIDYEDWQPNSGSNAPEGNYVLGYAKNRVGDVCNPSFLNVLANRFPNVKFYTTFAPKDPSPNIHEIGVIPHSEMQKIIEGALCVISPIKETFGVLTLEAMAAAKPVLGYAHGGNLDLVRHGVTGYLAHPNNIDDLEEGLGYCLKYHKELGANGREIVKQYSWDKVCQKLYEIYNKAIFPDPATVTVVIPSYNYASRVGDAIASALNQSYKPERVIVVDDGSPDDGATARVVGEYASQFPEQVVYVRQDNAGVAVARNRGIDLATSKYICCLDADDSIEPDFLAACINVLEQDQTLGVAYTGLMTISPDGKRQVSAWPPEYNFDNMVRANPKGINQIPTCCVFRKEMWRRLGGYRQRYAPQGAGSEDAEFWLRGGLHGWGARKATPAPMFHYSYMTGNVSGNRQYVEMDWHALHPACLDGLHPFPSVAKPIAGMPSHPVLQYDEPAISVIIPVGKGHKSVVFDALDSLESQSYRRWEVIVVDDSGEEGNWTFDGVSNALLAYPYVRMVTTTGNRGAGYARNRGAEAARAPLLLFLDADDILYSTDALLRFIEGWNKYGTIIYSDYVSKAIIDKDEAKKLQQKDVLVSYNEKSQSAVIRREAPDYDCERAVVQPVYPLYIWNLITSLVPKAWHDEIGGFDESMKSWEDWLYWLLHAKNGRCFERIAEPLVMYRMDTGSRRDEGYKLAKGLIDYIKKTLEGVGEMPCPSGCGSKKVASPSAQQTRIVINKEKQAMNQIADQDMVLCVYVNPNRGQHRVVGQATGIDYRYRAGGGTERFYVHKRDVAARPDFFKPVPMKTEAAPAEIRRAPTPAPVPMHPPTPNVSVDEEEEPEIVSERSFDLQTIPGLTYEIASGLENLGVLSWEDVVKLSVDDLTRIKGVGERRAQTILAYAKKVLDSQ